MDFLSRNPNQSDYNEYKMWVKRLSNGNVFGNLEKAVMQTDLE